MKRIGDTAIIKWIPSKPSVAGFSKLWRFKRSDWLTKKVLNERIKLVVDSEDSDIVGGILQPFNPPYNLGGSWI